MSSTTKELGAFSVSLAVKNIERSKAFYQKLGFKIVGGDQSQNWLILRNGDHTIGLFQGMFDDNILTFNPGWDKDNNKLDDYTDVREIHKNLKAQGIEMKHESITSKAGPASFAFIDPDGNSILIDQHV